MIRRLGYTDLVTSENRYVAGWGVNLSARLRPVAPLTIYASVNTGRGIGSMINDLSFSSNDLLGYADEHGKMYAPASYGWYGAVQYNFRPNIFSTIIFSQERILLKNNTIYDADGYRYGLYGTANVFWNVVPRLQVGAEFTIGKRANQNGEHRNGYRASVLASYSF